MKHDCIIGMLNHSEYSELVTLDDLKKHIEDNIEFNKSLDADPVFRRCKDIYAKVWTLKNYGDKRKNTDLTRFDFCPVCGKPISWRTIKEAQ